MDLSPRLIPGHVAPCESCSHRSPDLSHPTPCGRVRWEGYRHHKPELQRTGSGVTCVEFQPVAELEGTPA